MRGYILMQEKAGCIRIILVNSRIRFIGSTCVQFCVKGTFSETNFKAQVKDPPFILESLDKNEKYSKSHGQKYGHFSTMKKLARLSNGELQAQSRTQAN